MICFGDMSNTLNLAMAQRVSARQGNVTVNLTENGEEKYDSGDCGVDGRHGVGECGHGWFFERGWCHTTFRSWRLGI